MLLNETSRYESSDLTVFAMSPALYASGFSAQPAAAGSPAALPESEDRWDMQRQELLGARLMVVHGTWQREGAVKNLVAARLEDLTPLPGRLARATVSRDFR